MSVILVIEDDRKINQLLCSILQQGGMETRSAFDGMEGWEMAVKNEYSLILMDLMLPLKSGEEILRELRQIKTQYQTGLSFCGSVQMILLISLLILTRLCCGSRRCCAGQRGHAPCWNIRI